MRVRRENERPVRGSPSLIARGVVVAMTRKYVQLHQCSAAVRTAASQYSSISLSNSDRVSERADLEGLGEQLSKLCGALLGERVLHAVDSQAPCARFSIGRAVVAESCFDFYMGLHYSVVHHEIRSL